jgi:hypothetical protein
VTQSRRAINAVLVCETPHGLARSWMRDCGSSPHNFGRRICFFRKRLALATARRCHGANIETGVALPPVEISADPAAAAASAFSLNIRLYSAGEHLFSAISNPRSVTVSHDAKINSVIMVGIDVLRRLRAFMTNDLRDKNAEFCCHTILI